MITGFEKIVEERIKKAQRNGAFDNLPGAGKPLKYDDDRHIPEDLRLAYKMLKNADYVPAEIELKKEIARTEDLLAGMTDTAEKYRTIQKLNLLVMKFNALRSGSVAFDIPQRYLSKVVGKLESK